MIKSLINIESITKTLVTDTQFLLHKNLNPPILSVAANNLGYIFAEIISTLNDRAHDHKSFPKSTACRHRKNDKTS